MEAGFPSELCSHELRYSRLQDVSMRSGESWLLSLADLSAVWAGEDTKVFLGPHSGEKMYQLSLTVFAQILVLLVCWLGITLYFPLFLNLIFKNLNSLCNLWKRTSENAFALLPRLPQLWQIMYLQQARCENFILDCSTVINLFHKRWFTCARLCNSELFLIYFFSLDSLRPSDGSSSHIKTGLQWILRPFIYFFSCLAPFSRSSHLKVRNAKSDGPALPSSLHLGVTLKVCVK